jgi:hypothetical protein
MARSRSIEETSAPLTARSKPATFGLMRNEWTCRHSAKDAGSNERQRNDVPKRKAMIQKIEKGVDSLASPD